MPYLFFTLFYSFIVSLCVPVGWRTLNHGALKYWRTLNPSAVALPSVPDLVSHCECRWLFAGLKLSSLGTKSWNAPDRCNLHYSPYQISYPLESFVLELAVSFRVLELASSMHLFCAIVKKKIPNVILISWISFNIRI